MQNKREYKSHPARSACIYIYRFRQIVRTYGLFLINMYMDLIIDSDGIVWRRSPISNRWGVVIKPSLTVLKDARESPVDERAAAILKQYRTTCEERLQAKTEKRRAILSERAKRQYVKRVKSTATKPTKPTKPNPHVVCMIAGVTYPSIAAAATATGLRIHVLKYRLDRNLHDSHYVCPIHAEVRRKRVIIETAGRAKYARDNRAAMRLYARKRYKSVKSKDPLISKSMRPVIVDGVRYESRAAAARACKIDASTIDWRIKSNNFDVYYE